MFLLDTNVLSVLMSAQPVPAVAAWFAERPEEFLVIAAVCRAEVLAGIAVLPQGRKRRSLEAAAVALFHDELNGRVLPFDGEAAVAYAEIFAARRRAGRPIGMADLMIAATARAHAAAVITRDVMGFEGCGIDVVDPWGL